MSRRRSPANRPAVGLDYDLAAVAQYAGAKLPRAATLAMMAAVRDNHGGYVTITEQRSFFRELVAALWRPDQSLWVHLDVNSPGVPAGRWQHFEADQVGSFDFWLGKQTSVPGGLAPLHHEPLFVVLAPPGLDPQVIDDIEVLRQHRRGNAAPGAGEAFARLVARGCAVLDISKSPAEMMVYDAARDLAELKTLLTGIAAHSGVDLHPAHLMEL